MSAGLDGDIKLGVDLETKSAMQSLNSYRKKMRDAFSGNGVKNIDDDIKRTASSVKGLEKEITALNKKLSDIKTAQVTPPSIKNLQQEIKETEKDISSTLKRLDELSKKRSDIQSKGSSFKQSTSDVKVGKKYFSADDANALKGINLDISELNKRFGDLSLKADNLNVKLKNLQANPQLTKEAQEYNIQLDNATYELQKQQAELTELKAKQGQFNSSVGNSNVQFNGMQKNLRRVKELIKSALVFSVITKGFTAMRDAIGGIISQNDTLMSSLNQIKGNLVTAFAPIWEIIMPYLQGFLNILAQVTAYIAQFVAMLTGKSIAASKQSAKALQQQASATKKAGKANSEAAEEAEKSTLAFDELNTISSPQENTSASSGGADVADGANKTFETTDVEISESIIERLKAILVLVGLIGGAFGLWKLTVSFIGGILLIIAGAILLVKNYSDAWVNGLNWSNFAMIIGGLALLIAGIALAISPVAAAFVAVGGGIAMVVLGIKDFMENGYSMQSVLMILVGAIVAIVGVLLLFNVYLLASPITWIVIGIMALVAAFVILWNECEGFRNFWITLWENIKSAAKTTWEEYLQPAIKAIGDAFKWLWDNILSPFVDFIVNIFKGNWEDAILSLKETANGFSELIGKIFGKGAGDSVKDILNGFIDFVTGVFTGDWGKAWEGIKQIFTGIINGIITCFESMINFIIRGVNKLIEGINKLIGKAGDVIGFELSIPTIPEIELPRLAKGAVLPPNREFLAVLGDQKQGMNIEAPASLIKQMVNEALEERSYSDRQNINISFTGNLAQLARVLKPSLDKEATRKGTKLVTGGAY